MNKEMETKMVSCYVRDNLHSRGYFYIKTIASHGVCAISKQGILYSVFCNISDTSYSYRYSFETLFDAYLAFYDWNGEFPMSGNWVERIENTVTTINSNYKPEYSKTYFSKVA